MVAFGALAVAAPAAGQQTEQDLVRRLDGLVPQWEAAQAANANLRERLAREVGRRNGAVDTIRVGPLTMLVRPGRDAVARDVVGTVWRRDFTGWVDRSPALERTTFFFDWSADRKRFDDPDGLVRVIQGSSHDSRKTVEAAVRDAVGDVLQWDLTHSGLADWPDWRVYIASPTPRARLYREMVLSSSTAVRSCIAGDLPECVSATVLKVDAYPLDDWYSPTERLALGSAPYSPWHTTESNAPGCFRNDVTACDAALRTLLSPRDYLLARPRPSSMRGSLLWFALQEGGAHAWSHLLAGPGGGLQNTLESDRAAEIISYVAGEPLDVVITKWRRWVAEDRPVVDAGFGRILGVTLVWIVLLSALAMRSKRCRLG
ncbi:MAG: hypothetical protein LJF04_18515 [Gemmatimonadetes bacterium]|nr:hypothetical protein [Gemmatimonadota bacterium]